MIKYLAKIESTRFQGRTVVKFSYRGLLFFYNKRSFRIDVTVTDKVRFIFLHLNYPGKK